MASWLAQHLEESDLAGLPVYKRDRHSLHVRQRDGSVMAEFSTRPLHYRDEHGAWRQLDTSLRPVGNEYGIPGLDVVLSPEGGVRIAGTKHRQHTSQFVILDIATGNVKRVNAKLAVGRVEDDSLIRDAGTYQHRLRVTPFGLREELTINSPLSGTSANEWAMLETEIRGRSLPDGFLDKLEGMGRYQFRHPVCSDARGQQINARWYAKQRGGRQMLYTGVPLAWLSAAAYPVVLDPDFSSNVADGYIYSTDGDYATARSTSGFMSFSLLVMAVGQAFSGGKVSYYEINRSYLLFDTSSINLKPVVSASLLLAPYQAGGTTLLDDVEITKLDWSLWNPVTVDNREAAFDAALVAAKDGVWRSSGFVFVNDTYYESSDPLDTSWINRVGNTYYGLLGKNDRDGTAPTGGEKVYFRTSESAFPPLLRVVYDDAYPSAHAGIAICRTSGALAALPVNAGGSAARTALPSIAGVSYG